MNASLISIRPRFVEAIFAGDKWIELRRRRLHAEEGHVLFVYETSPVMAVRGIVQVARVESASVSALWRRVRTGAHVSFGEYLDYFRDQHVASAIWLTELQAFDRALTLSDIRRHSPLFHPPRTWTSFSALPLPLQVQLREWLPGSAPVRKQRRDALAARPSR